MRNYQSGRQRKYLRNMTIRGAAGAIIGGLAGAYFGHEIAEAIQQPQTMLGLDTLTSFIFAVEGAGLVGLSSMVLPIIFRRAR